MTRDQPTLASGQRDILSWVSHILAFSFAPTNHPKLTGIDNSHFIKLLDSVSQESWQRAREMFSLSHYVWGLS